MTELDLLALDLGANSRTLRRAARRGAIRVHRVSPNKPTIDLAERRYLDAHWPLLAKLARALRTEKNVRLAVLFGSAARGDDRPGSDVDLLVDLGDYGRRLPIARLELRLEEALGRPVQVVALRDAQASPALLSEAVADGRVIVDRDGGWLRLKRRKPRLRRLASRLRGANARAGPARARGARRAVTGSTPQLPRAIAERLRDLRLHRDTLLYAMGEIGEGFPRDRFIAAARSRDPAQRAKVLAVERGFEILMNYTIELVVAALVEAGRRDRGEETSAPREFRRLRDEGGISSDLCERLVALHRTRNDLQHDYPAIQAATLHDALTELLDAFGLFMRSYSRWVREHLLDEDAQ